MYLIPCAISVLRALCLIPLLFLFPSYPLAAFLVFMAGAVSDWFDGFLARKFNAESELGKSIDPIADKILYIGSLVMLKNIIPMLILFTPALLFEALLTGIRFKKSHHGKRAANPYGKLKTTVQFCAIACMMLGAITEVKILIAFGFSLGLVAIPLAMMSFSAHIYPKKSVPT